MECDKCERDSKVLVEVVTDQYDEAVSQGILREVTVTEEWCPNCLVGACV